MTRHTTRQSTRSKVTRNTVHIK